MNSSVATRSRVSYTSTNIQKTVSERNLFSCNKINIKCTGEVFDKILDPFKGVLWKNNKESKWLIGYEIDLAA